MNTIFNSLNGGLNKLDQTLHHKTKNSVVDNFIHELQSYLEKRHSYELFKQLPKNTNFALTGYDNNFLECMEYTSRKLYYVPTGIISGKEPELGETLTFNNKNKLVINYGGIPLWEHQIPEFKNDCTIAK